MEFSSLELWDWDLAICTNCQLELRSCTASLFDCPHFLHLHISMACRILVLWISDFFSPTSCRNFFALPGVMFDRVRPTQITLLSSGQLFHGKRESESYSVMLTLCNPMDYTVHGILQARIPEWVAFPFSRGSSQPGTEPRSSALEVDSLPAEPQEKSKNTAVGMLSFLQWIFLN